MLGLSAPLFSTVGWPIEDYPSSYEHSNYFSADSSPFQLPTTLQQQFVQLADYSTPTAAVSGDSNGSPMSKKLNHNASERERRKKMNTLYSSLRSLVPADHEKKLSIPATVSRVLKYIPELQQQVDGLLQKRDELLSKTSKQNNVISQVEQAKGTAAIPTRSRSSLCAVTTTRLTDTEISIQISTIKSANSFLPRILQSLEEDGMELLHASTFEPSGGRVFYNLFLQANMLYSMKCENISEKLMVFYA